MMNESTPENHLLKWQTFFIDGTIVLLTCVIVVGNFYRKVFRDPMNLAIGNSDIDLPAQIWLLWWSNHPEKQDLVNYPFGDVDFYLLTPIHSMVANILFPNVILAHNLVTLVGIVLCIVSGACLGRYFGRHWSCVFVGGLFLGLSSPLIAALYDGTGEFIWVGMVAFSLLVGDWFSKTPSIPAGILLSILLAGTIYCSWYYGAATLLGVFCLAFRDGRPWLKLLPIPMSILLSSSWIASFSASDFEIREVQDSLWEQMMNGGLEGPDDIADTGMQEIPLFFRTQLSLNEVIWKDIWFVVLMVLVCVALIKRKKVGVWIGIALLSFFIGLGSYLPNGVALPMLYINRGLEWFGVGMHLPFHISIVGVVSLVIAGLHAGRFSMLGILPLLFYAVVVIGKISSWRPPNYPALSTINGPILHFEETIPMSLAALNQVMSYQLSHQQPITSFPVFPTDSVKKEGILRLKENGQNMDPFALKELGYKAVTYPRGVRANPKFEQCCQRIEDDRLIVYLLE